MVQATWPVNVTRDIGHHFEFKIRGFGFGSAKKIRGVFAIKMTSDKHIRPLQ
jgi:hypothetical protein